MMALAPVNKERSNQVLIAAPREDRVGGASKRQGGIEDFIFSHFCFDRVTSILV